MTQNWMDIAWKQEGQKEIPGAAANPEIIAYFRDAGHPEVQSDEVSWCAAYTCACLERAGIMSPRSLLARDFLRFGTPIDVARIGAIAVFSRPPNPVHGHVGFVAGETADAIVLLGGNQANAVSVIHMPKARLLGLRWPGETLSAGDLKAQGSRTIAAADSGIKAQALAGGATLAGIAGSAAQTSAPAGLTMNAVASKASEMKGIAELFIEIGKFVAHTWLWLAGALAVYFGAKAIWHAIQVKKYRTEDANTGTHAGPVSASAPVPTVGGAPLIGGSNAALV